MFNRFCFGALMIACLAVLFTGCNINSKGLDSIQVTPATNSIAVGSTEQLTATGTYGNASHSSTGSVAGVTWSSANTSVAIVGPCTSGATGCPKGGLAAGEVLAEGNGTTTITATAAGFNGQVSSTVSVTVTGGTGTGPVSSEGLISLTIIPSSITVDQLQDTGNFIVIGTYTVAPTVRDVTNQAVWLSSAPEIFPVDTNTGGNAGATAGIVTAYGNGTANIIAEMVDSGNKGSIQYAMATFACPLAEPCPCSIAEGCNPAITDCGINGGHGGTCYPGSQQVSLLSTLTVYNEGLNTTNWLITASSATSTPDVISCGPGWALKNGLPTGSDSVCVATYPLGVNVILTATQPTASTGTFGGWSWDCTPSDASGNPLLGPVFYTATGPNYCTVTVGTPNPNYGKTTLDPNYPGSNIEWLSSNVTVGAIFN